MKRIAIFLQIVIVLIGISVFAFMLWEPHLEGRNVHSTLFEIYFKDPFLAFAYIASTPFFISLYQAIKVLGYFRKDKVFSIDTVKSMRTIKYCSISIIVFALVGEIIILLSNSDDRAGGVFIGSFVIIGAIITGFLSTKFEQLLNKTMNKYPGKI